MKNTVCRRRGFTLIEILVAVALLSLSLAAIVTIWSVSRKITERSRDWSEYYAVARQEAEKMRVYPYSVIFARGDIPNDPNNNLYVSGVRKPIETLYTQDGTVTTTATSAYYAAVSTFNRKPTGTEDSARQLGVQVIDVYLYPRPQGGGTPVYSTTMFFTVGGV